MGIQSTFYNTSGGDSRKFPSTKFIASKSHVAVYGQDAETLLYDIYISAKDYDLVFNAVVFYDVVTYDSIEVRVADTPDELTDNPSAITIVAGSIDSVNTLALNIDDVNDVADDIAKVVAVNDTIIPELDEILLADTNAAIATAKAVEASASAVSSASSASASAISASASLASENASATSETNASNSATASATSATESAASAASIVGDRDAAEASAIAAATSETNALASATSASTSSSTAIAQASIATTKATEASSSAASASTSASTATTKASEASVSATSASNSATASATSATASAASAASITGDVASAETAATNAALSASLALDAQTAAETAEANAVLVSNVTKWVSGNTYTAGDVVWSTITYQTFRRKSDGVGTTDPSADATNWSRLTIDFALTAQPLISISSSVNEGGTTQGTITTNYDANATYTIWAGLGSISNISGNTFDFTAHDISNGLDTIDSIYIYAEKVGELRSETTTETINIIHVDIIEDKNNVIQIVDFTDEAQLNDGFDLI